MNDQEVKDLALQYLPIFYFHENEHFGPMRFDEFVGSCKLWQDDNDTEWFGESLTPVQQEGAMDMDVLMAMNNNADKPRELFLDYAGWGDGGLDFIRHEECNPDGAFAKYGGINLPRNFHLYAHIAPGEAFISQSKLVDTIQYYKDQGYYNEATRVKIVANMEKIFRKFMALSYAPFYCMQDSPRFGGMDYHEGDLEDAVTIIFNYKARLDQDHSPRYVAYKRHGIQISSDFDMMAWDGEVKTADGYDEVERTGDHPHAWVAGGSHATYPKRGYYSRRGIPQEVFDYYWYVDPLTSCALFITHLVLEYLDIPDVARWSLSDDDDATGGGKTVGEAGGNADWKEDEIEVIDRFNNKAPRWWDGYKGRMGLKVKKTLRKKHTSGPQQGSGPVCLIGENAMDRAVFRDLCKDDATRQALLDAMTKEAMERVREIAGIPL